MAGVYPTNVTSKTKQEAIRLKTLWELDQYEDQDIDGKRMS